MGDGYLMDVWKVFYDINETNKMKVEITVEADDESYEPTLAAITNLTEELGVPTSISKHLKFDDLGLALMSNGHFQCLACSRTYASKPGAVRHYKNMHPNPNQFLPTVQCPRCNDEMSKSDLNRHMEAKHGVENFDQMLKRSFKPPISTENLAKKLPNKKIKRDPIRRDLIKREPIRRDLIKRELFKKDPIKKDLSNLTQDVWQEDYNNNIVTIEENVQDSKTNIKNEFNIVKIEEDLQDSKTNIKYELDEKPGTFEGYHRTIFAPNIKSENFLIQEEIKID